MQKHTLFQNPPASSDSLPAWSQWLQDRLFPISVAVVTILALAVRLSLYPFQSGDYLIYLEKWYAQIAQGGGLPALRQPLADCNYTIAYLTLLTPFTALHVPALAAVKTISVTADFALACSCALLQSAVWPDCAHPRRARLLIYTAVLLFPEAFFNSAFWAQCDAIYITFLVLTIFFLARHRSIAACAMFGLAFAFKMQAVFLLPLLLITAAGCRWFRLSAFLAAPAALVLTCVPAMLCGTPIWMTYWPYLVQLGCCGSLSVNSPGIGMLLGHLPFVQWKYALLAVTLLALYAALTLALQRGGGLSPYELLLVGTWTCLCCVTLLPCMHERYAFPADLLLLVLALFSHQRGDHLCFLVESAVSLFSWMQYLDPKTPGVSSQALSCLRFACLLWLSLHLWRHFNAGDTCTYTTT
ncbi:MULTISPECIES: glycosyltransferase 87 family protein [Caproicibacterium]|uniref:Glycosyltransferase 87 family protein n=1 Tax=Caproicibacterium argilliputei TaxID=3030016 RepID=A0AA97DBS1_9FIRM|nr:glycosyltransferase 87 family protein [Caproicibacterium argilliputei]WOC32695.1 glycosyltransferase 87 family protein [Caproicibacterium argilliputei]